MTFRAVSVVVALPPGFETSSTTVTNFDALHD
jgi:hypothetical protein